MAIDLNELKEALDNPARIVLLGGRGIGKTTIATDAPAPFFINLEKSKINKNLGKGNQSPQTYAEVIDLIQALCEQKHGYKSLVIDTLDKLEIMITDHVCKVNGYSNINQTKWGEGLSKRHDEWCNLLNALDWLCENKQMYIILVAHTVVEKVVEPMLPEYDKHTIKIYKRDGPMILDWSDINGMCKLKVYTTSEGERHMATSRGERVICCLPEPTSEAKTRYCGMPEEIPLKWSEFAQYFRTNKNTNGDE